MNLPEPDSSPASGSRKKKRKKAGRRFEELVAELERATHRQDARIKSPDFAKDKISGKEREIDVGIRFKAGDYEILIACQCRDRGRVQGPDWIEELHAWQHSIGANLVVAVCRAGFSDAALEKAKFYGIKTKTVSSVTGAEFKEWKQQALTLDVTAWRSSKFFAMIPAEDTESIEHFKQHSGTMFQKDTENTVIAVECSTGHATTLKQIMRAWAKDMGKAIMDGLPKTGEWQPFLIRIDCQTPSVLPLAGKNLPIKGIQLPIELCRGVADMPAIGTAYKDEQNKTAFVHSHWLADVGKMFPHGTGNLLRIIFNNIDMTQES